MTAWIDSLATRKAALAAVPYLADLPEEELSALAQSARVRRWRKGQTVFAEGDACHGLYVVAAGRIRILRLSAAGREQVLHTESEGAIGEAPLLDEGPYPASGRAASDLVTLFLARADVLDGCRRRPELALGLAAALAGRVRRFASLAESLALHQVHQRLAAYLLERVESSPDFEARAADAAAEVVLEETNQEIAAQIGTVRELVSRLLGDFRRRGAPPPLRPPRHHPGSRSAARPESALTPDPPDAFPRPATRALSPTRPSSRRPRPRRRPRRR